MKTKGKGGMKTYFSTQNVKKKKKNNWALKVDTKIYCTVSIRAPQRAPMGRETKKNPMNLQAKSSISGFQRF